MKNKGTIILISYILVGLGIFIYYLFTSYNNYYINQVSTNQIDDTKIRPENMAIEQIDSVFDSKNSSNKTLEENGIFVDNNKNENLKIEEVQSGTDLEKLIKLQKEIEKIKDEQDKLTGDLFILNNEISTYKTEIRKNEKNKENKEKILGTYLKWIHMTHNTLDLYLSILQASNLNEVVYNYNLTNQFIKKTISNINELSNDNYTLDLNRDDIVNKKALYQAIIRDITIKENELIDKHNEIVTLISNNNKLFNESYSSTTNLNNRINSNKFQYYGNPNGFMIIPVEGYTITSEWGDRVHPISGVVKHHAGVDLAVDTGTIVRAAANGIVSMASWYGGYGKAVMINHGNGIVTLYGHNSKILVSEGDLVQQGQPIALAGSTGYSTGPHCHFEVRYNDSDIDPFTYIK